MINWISAGDPGVKPGSCPSRKESKPLNSKSASLFLMNYFPTYPVETEACKEHSTPLAQMVGTCYKAAGNLMPNFLAVNFYMVLVLACTNRCEINISYLSILTGMNMVQRSDGGGVFDAMDRMNGQACGCSTVTACQVYPFYLCHINCLTSTLWFSCFWKQRIKNFQFWHISKCMPNWFRLNISLFNLGCIFQSRLGSQLASNLWDLLHIPFHGRVILVP